MDNQNCGTSSSNHPVPFCTIWHVPYNSSLNQLALQVNTYVFLMSDNPQMQCLPVWYILRRYMHICNTLLHHAAMNIFKHLELPSLLVHTQSNIFLFTWHIL